MDSPLPRAWTKGPVWNAICLPPEGLHSSVWYSNKLLSKVRVSSCIPTSSSHQKLRGRGANVGFIPTICACVKYRFLWKAQRTSSTFHWNVKNNKPVKVLHSIWCLHNKLFPIKLVFFVITSAERDLEEKSCNLCIKYIHVPLYSCCSHVSLFFLPHSYRGEGSAVGWRALLGSSPGPTSAWLLFLSLPLPNSIGSVVSPFQGLSQGPQMCYSEQQWSTLAEISSVSD